MTRLFSYFLLVLLSVSALLVWHVGGEQQEHIEYWVSHELAPHLQNLPVNSTSLSLDKMAVPAEQLMIWRGDQLVAEYVPQDHLAGQQLNIYQGEFRIELYIRPDLGKMYQLIALWVCIWSILVLPALWHTRRSQQITTQLKTSLTLNTAIADHEIPSLISQKIQLFQQQVDSLQQQESSLLNDIHQLTQAGRLQSEQVHTLTLTSQEAQRELHWLKAILQQLNNRRSLTGLGFELELLKRYLASPAQSMLSHFPTVSEWYQDTLRNPLAGLFPAARLLVDEDPNGMQYKISVDVHECRLAVESVMRELKPLLQSNELETGYRISLQPRPAIELQFKYQGYEFPSRFQKILKGESGFEPSLQDLPAYVLATLIQHRGYSWQLESVAGVGGRLNLTLPAVIERVNLGKKYQTLCLMDPLECRANLARRSLQTIAEQIIWVQQFADLQTELKLRLVDKVLVFFEQMPNEVEVKQLEEIAQRYSTRVCVESMVSYPQSSEINWWSTPFFVADLLQKNDATSLGRQQILVVDDNAVNMNFVETMMSSMGVKIDKAFTGEEALQKAQANIYHVILMDIQLPDINGVEVTRQVRQMRHHQMTNIIAFTAHAMPDEIASFRLAGMDDVLIKPMDSRKVANLVHRLHLTPEIQ
ncbi:MAG TPA: hypothetical protein DCS87_11530 [Rheinheimera sp.]|nr:hypothetical protein [Rheinheimera sp.]